MKNEDLKNCELHAWLIFKILVVVDVFITGNYIYI